MKYFLTVAPLLLFSTFLLAQSFSTVSHLGRDHIKVVTKTATYLYDPAAGGFSSIYDPAGNDWVSYRDTPWGEYPASAASSYRGVPNLVFGGEDDGAGHPGHRKCESRITGNQITSQTLSGDWRWVWTFTKRGARLEVEQTPEDGTYWFLYEGPAAGSYRPKTSFWATDLTAPSYVIPDHFTGEAQRGYYQTMWFGEDSSAFIFAMHQRDADTRRDHISYLGNEEIGAENSPDGMIVAGFGRDEGATPLLQGANTFFIAILKKSRTARLRKQLRRLFGRFPR